jgi:hypothetical protein
MWKKTGVILIIFLLLATLLAVVAFYNSETSNLKEKIAGLEGQVDSLNLQLANFSTVNLVPSLNVTDRISGYYYPTIVINGSVYNAGGQVAYHAGLQVVALDSGVVLMNITIPLYEGLYGQNYNYDLDKERLGYLGGMTYTYISSTSLDNSHIHGFDSVAMDAIIFHENLFPDSITYKVTPVWTNTP